MCLFLGTSESLTNLQVGRAECADFFGESESLTNLQVGRAECARRGGILRIGRVSSLSLPQP